MLTDNDIDKLIADPECWDGGGLGARFDKVAFARKVEAMAMAAERERCANLCDAVDAEHPYADSYFGQGCMACKCKISDQPA